MSTCAACRNTRSDDVTFHRFPQVEEQRDQWIFSMGRYEGWTPSETSALCSEHFTPECFHPSGLLQPDAIPTVFNSPVKEADVVEEPEHLNSKKETSAPPSTSTGPPCDCEKRIAVMEKSYRLKLLTLQLQVKKYQIELSDQSRQVVKLRRKVMVLQSAAKVLSMRTSSTPKISAHTPTEHV
ncbi:THAP domain-containing protein 1 [Trichomycterus rosablanca]|uniref:THAP domain-containing protein 1 n=1 Tax=Trichomycterus rosablanca TaxID=2290929 RepID=UPI002F3581D0